MRLGVAILCALAIVVAAGCGSTKTVTRTVTIKSAKLSVGPPREVVVYGYIRSLKQKGSAYDLRFDPALLLSGKTASQAALEDTGSSDVPNDNYIVEEGHRVLTYILPLNARVTVLTNAGTGINATPIPVPELARIVNGGKHRKLFEPLESGLWMRVRIDTVKELDQQYRP
jgi:hypothetical protein